MDGLAKCRCGGQAELKFKPGSYGYYPGYYYVACKKCGIRTVGRADEGQWESGKGTPDNTEQAKAAAAADWHKVMA